MAQLAPAPVVPEASTDGPGAPRWTARRLIAPAVVLVASVAVFAVLIVTCTDLSAWTAAHTLFEGAFGSVDAVSETLTRAIPLAIVAVGASVALRAGVFNVGGEGQMAMGAVAAAIVLKGVGSAPALVAWALAGVAAMAGGAAWAAVPAVLWARRGVSEILTTLLMNFIAASFLAWLLLKTFLHDPSPYVITAQGEQLPTHLELPLLLSGSRLHAGLWVAVAATLLTWWWLRTPAGLRVDLVGANPALAAHAGVRPVAARIQLLLFSAAVAGLAGVVQLVGLSHRLTTGLTAGVGYTGLLVAVLGRARPLLAAAAAVVFAALITGGEALERSGVGRSLVNVVQAVLVVGVALATRVRPAVNR